MNKTFDFYFDYGSPYSYLANTQLHNIAKNNQAEIIYKPVLLGGIFKNTGNISPVQNPVQSKVQYGIKDINDWVDFYGCQFNFNPHFPVNTLKLMRLSCCLQNHEEKKFLAFHAAAFEAMWIHKKDMANDDELKFLLTSLNIDENFIEKANETENKERLIKQTEDAINRGIFGLPAFFIKDLLFFGNDRLPLVEQILKKER